MSSVLCYATGESRDWVFSLSLFLDPHGLFLRKASVAFVPGGGTLLPIRRDRGARAHAEDRKGWQTMPVHHAREAVQDRQVVMGVNLPLNDEGLEYLRNRFWIPQMFFVLKGIAFFNLDVMGFRFINCRTPSFFV